MRIHPSKTKATQHILGAYGARTKSWALAITLAVMGALSAGSPQAADPSAEEATSKIEVKQNASALKPAPRDSNTKRILLITGEDYPGHLWRETAPVLRSELQKDKRLKIDVVEDLKSLGSLKLDKYATIVMHFKNYDPEIPGRLGYENLASFVEKGGGLVLVHFACGAFQEFKDDFVKLAGRAWDPKLRGHDKFGPFMVNITKTDHPITRGLNDFETTDELYTCLAGDTPITPLATAVSNVDQKTYPMAFVLNYGKGRVFHSVLGHDPAALNNPPVAELYRRATAWAAGLSPDNPTQ